MKKLPLLLFFLAVVSCVHRGKTTSSADESEKIDSLSEISQKITAIPLETNPQCLLSELKQVKQANAYIFIWNGNDIYRFSHQGVFINRVTSGNHYPVRAFTINHDNKHVIVLDTLNLVHSYAYDGNLLYTEDAEAFLPGQTILDILYHNNYLWAVTENMPADNRFEQWMYKLNLSFRPLEGAQIASVDLGRFYLAGNIQPKLFLTGQHVCVYAPFFAKEKLLTDTLYIVSSGQLNQKKIFPYRDNGNDFPAYSIPFMLSKRYLIASCQTHESERENYLFCFDRKTNKAFNMNGLRDDFYQTGIVKDLHPFDQTNQEFYFCKSGKDVTASFPDRKEDANPVLFVVKLNG